MKLPIVTSYSNLQLRIGYLKILAAMGNRTATTNEAFERKLSPLFPASSGKDSAFGAAGQGASLSYIEGLFQNLGHDRGKLNRNNLNELVTLGKAFGFLHPTNCALFEIAVVLRSIMGSSAIATVQAMDTGYNPLRFETVMERAFFLIVVLTTDLPVALAACVAAKESSTFRLYRGFPGKGKLEEGKNAFKPKEKGGRRSGFFALPDSKSKLDANKQAKKEDLLVPYSLNSLLLSSYELIAPMARKQLSITNWKEWVTYFEGDEPRSAFDKIKYFRMGKRSSFRHHAAPRLEFLVDLGLLQHASPKPDDTDKKREVEDSDYSYEVTDFTRRFASCFSAHFLEQSSLDIDKFVRERVMQCFGETFCLSLTEASGTQPLEFLLKSYQAVKRDIGTTPMWTVAIMASLFALDNGIRLEIDSLYKLARQKAQEPSAQIRLSGGSRFDGEFLIGISPELLKDVT